MIGGPQKLSPRTWLEPSLQQPERPAFPAEATGGATVCGWERLRLPGAPLRPPRAQAARRAPVMFVLKTDFPRCKLRGLIKNYTDQ